MPNTRKALSVLLLGLTGWWTIDHQAERATPDERAVLDLVVRRMTDQCLAPATDYRPYSSSGFGTYGDPDGLALSLNYHLYASTGREAVLLANRDDEQSLLRFVPTPLVPAGCTNATVLGTPTFMGKYAFVSYDRKREGGVFAFERGPAGWELVDSAHHRAGPVI